MAWAVACPTPLPCGSLENISRSITVVMTAVGPPSACSRDGALTWVGEEQHVEKVTPRID
jgi:hypothetical protein